jgi:hypothetical protein
MYIATNNGIKPNGAAITNLYIANNGRIWSNETIISP